MTKKATAIHRCSWAENDPLMRDYHDKEWGVPERDSRALWETLMLDGFQAGLSWLIDPAQARRLPQSLPQLRSKEGGALGRSRHPAPAAE